MFEMLSSEKTTSSSNLTPFKILIVRQILNYERNPYASNFRKMPKRGSSIWSVFFLKC